MPDSGGTYTREGGATAWTDDRNALVKIRADLHDTHDEDIATALTNRICKDGQTATTARIPFAFGIGTADGTVSAPAWNFTGDTNSGVWRIAADTIGVGVNGTAILSIGLTGLTVFGDLSLPDVGSQINFGTGDVVIEYTANLLEITGGDVRVVTAGTNTASVVTVGGTQTLTSKTLASPTVTGTMAAAAATFSGNVTLGDAAGDAVVVNAKSMTRPNGICFLASNSVIDSNVTGNSETVTVDFDTEITDTGGDFASDTFTAPVTGRYNLTGKVKVEGLVASTSSLNVFLVTSNRSYALVISWVPHSTTTIAEVPFGLNGVDMDAADTATVTVQVAASGGTTADIAGHASSPVTYFSGFLIG